MDSFFKKRMLKVTEVNLKVFLLYSNPIILNNPEIKFVGKFQPMNDRIVNQSYLLPEAVTWVKFTIWPKLFNFIDSYIYFTNVYKNDISYIYVGF